MLMAPADRQHFPSTADINPAGHLHGGGAVVLADLDEAVPVLSCHGLARPVLVDPQADEALAGEDGVGRGEERAVEADDLGGGLDEGGGQQALGLGLDPRLLLGGLLGEADEGLDRTRVELAFQPREEFTADAIAGEGIAGVGAVDEARLMEFAQAGEDRLAADGQQRSPQDESLSERPHLRNPGQSAQAGAAKEMVQDRLRIVIGGVAGEDSCGFD